MIFAKLAFTFFLIFSLSFSISIRCRNKVNPDVLQFIAEFLWLVVAGGVNSVISLYYYFHVVKVMFLGGKRSDLITYPPSTMFGLMIFTAVPSLLLGLYWNPLASWVKDSLVFYIQVM